MIYVYNMETGTGWAARPTGYQIPTVKVERLTPTAPGSEMYHSYEVLTDDIGEKQTKRNYNYLTKLATMLDISTYIIPAKTESEPEKNNLPDGVIDIMDLLKDPSPNEDPQPATPPAIIEVIEEDLTAPRAEDPEPETEPEELDHTDDSAPEEEPETIPGEKPHAQEGTADRQPEPETTEAAIIDAAEDLEPETTDSITEPEQTTAPTAYTPPAYDFAALATAYFTGPKNPPKRKTKPAPKAPPAPVAQEGSTAPEQTTEEPDPLYDTRFTPEEIADLSNGWMTTKTDPEYRHFTATYISAPYRNDIRLLYAFNVYATDDPTPRPGTDAKYIGFTYDGHAYTNKEKIQNQAREDIHRRVIELVPTKEAARANLPEGVNPAKLENRENAKSIAQRYFYEGTTPELKLTTYRPNDPDELINYITNRENYIEAHARELVADLAREIYENWATYTDVTEELNAIKADPTREEHQLKAIRDSITNQKTVKLLLTNGAEVKADAQRVRAITYVKYVSSYDVAAADRNLLPKDEYNRPDDIRLEDIVSIKYAGQTLYTAPAKTETKKTA